nr:YdcF family protein [Actinomycetota bacterium]
RSPLRRVVLSISLAMVVVLGYFLVSLYQVWSTGRGDQSAQAGAADAIVVLGAAQYDGTPSPQLAARLDHVVELWPQGVAPIVITTGGSRPGDRFSEAEASAAYLVERGVPDDAIIQDPTGSNTFESLEAVAVELGERGVDRVLIVTDPYHALRSRLIAQDVGLTAYVSPTTTSVVRGGTSLERHLTEAGGVALGRIVGFDRL